MYFMVENNMQGGIATISHRYARANNPLVEGHDPSTVSYTHLTLPTILRV